MEFSPSNLAAWNEQDVREELLAPVLKQLGYSKGTKNDVFRGQILTLRYPRLSLGRKKPSTDPELRGEADYVCDLNLPSNRHIRWVVEAKGPSVEIESDEIEQAYSYAGHPDVRAVYFCLCNGRIMEFFQTSLGPKSASILRVECSNLSADFLKIENLVGPLALERDWGGHELDIGVPIGKGLRSISQIVGGSLEYTETSLGDPMLIGMRVGISGGSIERGPENTLVSYFRTSAMNGRLDRMVTRLGLNNMVASSQDAVLSVDESRPTIFRCEHSARIPAGESVWNINTGGEFVLERDLSCRVTTESEGVLVGKCFKGHFRSLFSYPDMGVEVRALGTFEINLS